MKLPFIGLACILSCLLWEANLTSIAAIIECIQCGNGFAQANPERANAREKRLDNRAADFSRLDVFNRDDWTCGICSQPIDRDLRWPDRESASMDHIVPLSRGGAHTFKNVRATHLGCNVERGPAEDIPPSVVYGVLAAA